MSPRRPQSAFVLLEVMVCIVLIGVAMVGLMKGFYLSLDTIKRVRMNEQSILLSRAILDDLILEPPGEGNYVGRFEDDKRFGPEFAGWRWEIDVEPEEPEYEERPKGNLLQELEQLYFARVRIYFDEDGREVTYAEFDTILQDPELFSDQSIQGNQLF